MPRAGLRGRPIEFLSSSCKRRRRRRRRDYQFRDGDRPGVPLMPPPGARPSLDSTRAMRSFSSSPPPGGGQLCGKRPLLRAAQASWNYNGNGEDLSVHVERATRQPTTYRLKKLYDRGGRGRSLCALENSETALETATGSGNEQVNRLTVAQTHPGARSQASGPG